jgi:hypothetical protein
MSIPNVNQITTDLRMMGDQQLQQYAAMHKNDPYILPMAIAESNSRKALRAAKQAQDGGQPQGKVADQAIASMNAPPPQMAPQGMPPQGMPPQGGPPMAQQRLPEQQGIGALPVKNMQNMADGGIAGYADGGEFNYAGGGDPVVMMAEGGVAHFQDGGLAKRYAVENQEMISGNRVQYSPDVATYAEQLSTAKNAAYQAEQNAYADQERARMLRGPNSTTPVASKATMLSLDNNRAPDPRALSSMPSAATQLAQAADTVTSAPDNKQPPLPNLRPAGASTPAAPAAPEKSAAARLMDMQRETGSGDRKAIDEKQKEYETSLTTAATERSANLEKEIAARGEYGKAKEERLAAREAGLSKEKDTLLGLSALEMALGFFTGGPNAAIKSTQGALKTYGAGIASLKQAKEKIDDSRDQIDEFRRTESNMTARERREAANDINRTQIEIKKLGVEGLEKAYGYNREDAKTAFNAATQEGLTKLEIQGRKDVAGMQERGANARAAMPSGEMRTAMMLGSGKTDQEKLESGMIKYKELMGDKQGTQMLKLFLEENGRREKVGQEPISLENFRRTTAAFFAPPATVDTNKVDRS